MTKDKFGGKYTTILAAAVLLAVGLPATVRADSIQILLLGGTTQQITFKGSSNANTDLLQLGSCSAGTCTWAESKGSLSSGQNPLAGYTGVWSLSIPYSGSTYNLPLSNIGGGDWSVTQPSDINFTWGSAGCSGSGCYLTGDLQLNDILQKGSGGVFNLGLDANLIITGGSLASLVGSQDIYDYNIDFKTGKSLGSLGPEGFLTASGSSGEVLTPTPEPMSGLLLSSGFGLLLLGGGLRRLQRQAQ
ncbi:MAG TPA: hypothetical protein VI455_08965 [Terriglobia bacterium]